MLHTSEKKGDLVYFFPKEFFFFFDLSRMGFVLYDYGGVFDRKSLDTRGFFFIPRCFLSLHHDLLSGNQTLFPENSVTTLKSRKIFVVHDGNSFKAISVVCQHLGCAVEFSKEKNIFECPCHGSKYYRNGVNFAGPAPKTFKSILKLFSDDAGKAVVDTQKIVPLETELIV